MQRSLIFLLTIIVLSWCLSTTAMADSQTPSSSEATVHIVYVEKPLDQDPEDFHIQTLANVLGSKDAAKEAVIYHYKNAASGFSAKLTPEQVAEVAKQPGVLQVVLSRSCRTLQLHSGPGRVHV